MQHDHHSMPEAESTAKEYGKLAGIIVFLALAATLTSTLNGFNVEEWMRWFMGGFFIIFGGFKLIGYEMFVIMFRGYDIFAVRWRPYAYIYPFIELLLGVLYVTNLLPVPRDVVTLVIMSAGAYGILKSLHKGSVIKCACLGNIIKLPLSTVSLVEDVVMALMAAIMLLNNLFL